MHIDRIQVEEGFLDGLDLRLTAGLNVLIGARGTGKTSVIELIRFGLGVSGFTPESSRKALEHARSVLGSGHITVSVNMDGQVVSVSRNAEDPAPRADRTFRPPIVFSQTEIESVGLQPEGRLRLLDSFVPERRKLTDQEERIASEAKSLTTELETLSRELGALQEQLNERAAVTAALGALAVKEAEMAKTSAAVAQRKPLLDQVSTQISAAAVKQSYIERFAKTVDGWIGVLRQSQRLDAQPERWSGTDTPNPIGDLADRFTAAIRNIGLNLSEMESIREAVNQLLETNAAVRLRFDDESRKIRREIEAAQQGAGAVAKEGVALRQRSAQLDALAKLLEEKQHKLAATQQRRGAALDKLEQLRQERFELRRNIAARLTKDLGPRIRVQVERAGQFDEYTRLVTDALRGSGLRYNDIAPVLASRMSPRELLEATESHDFELVAEATGITKDRAARVLGHLRERGLAELSTCLVEDEVTFSLLDGQEFKDLAELSTGQRCTVILPIVLEHQDRVLVVDQPEDHIDNAFIADTVIKAIRNRSKKSQIVFSTHNANIPVLGEADRVIQMGSDGRRGFVLLAGELDDREMVQAITGVMEGGRAAFNKRAEFYSRNLPS